MIQHLIKNKCSWVKGSLSNCDMEFIFQTAIESNAESLVEIGVASGVSSTVILAAMAKCRADGRVSENYLHSFDILKRCFFDRKFPVGAAVQEMLPDEADRQSLHTQTTASGVKEYCSEKSVGFCFIDANHRHPWPSLDLLAILPLMKPDGIICLHDINLPLINQKFQVFGVKHVFDEVDCGKTHCNSDIPNCGALHLNGNADSMTNKLVELLTAYEWETNVDRDYLNGLNLDVDFLIDNPNCKLSTENLEAVGLPVPSKGLTSFCGDSVVRL